MERDYLDLPTAFWLEWTLDAAALIRAKRLALDARPYRNVAALGMNDAHYAQSMLGAYAAQNGLQNAYRFLGLPYNGLDA